MTNPTVLCVWMMSILSAAGQPASSPGETAGITSLPPITVYRDPSRYVAFPDVKRLPDGRLLCVFRDASFPDKVRHIEADARVVGCISTDDGRHWSEPTVIYDAETCQNDPCVRVLRDGRLLLTFFDWVGRSADYVAEHKPPYARRVDRGKWGDFAEPGGVFVLWGKSDSLKWDQRASHVAGTAEVLRAASASVIETKQGTLLLPIYGRSVKGKADQAYVLRSTDAGKSWSKEVLIAEDPANKVGMQEPALAQLPGGDIVTLMRTAGAEDHMYTTRSSDDGLTWTPPERTPLVGHPPDLLVLPDGRLLAAYGYRHKPFGVRACVSDDGWTWNLRREMVIAASGDHTDLGYPSICLTGDDHALIAYYMNGPDTKDRWIECKRIPLALLR